ncbi:phage tail assembly chaperone [uncultured Oscillibacter sp.]|uniref:phage tail assembly chaperone n=1 Tax=uncultured Oscillibacter sp. TaxID=876091 RepID=UPI0025D5FA2E|nr:hypothetical protein [uncultured Oscillibacter sp.]
MSDEKKVSTLDVLLRPELPDVRKSLEKKQVELPRLTELAGEPVVFTLRGLTYDKVRELQEKDDGLRALYIVLEGCEDPNWRDTALLDPSRGMATPLDAIKARLLPGEIEDLSREIQRLTGYLRRTIADVKNA